MVPALPDVLSGRLRPEALAAPLSEAAGPEVTIVQDGVQGIDLLTRTIQGTQQVYEYDYLVIAHGSTPRFFGFAPEDGTLHSIHSLGAATTFRAAVERHLSADPAAPILIVGAGYTGLEAASCLVLGTRPSGIRPRITVVDVAATPLSFLPERRRRRILAYFDRVGVEIRTEVSLEAFAGGTARLSDGSSIENALVLWAAGMQAQPTDIVGTVERARDGRLYTNEFLQLPAHPEVFAAGDAAALGAPTVLRRAVNFAFYSGRRAGQNVARLAQAGVAEEGASSGSARLRRFKPIDLGWIIPLGEKSVGTVFGAVPVGGRLGLRLHYGMSGFRQFPGGTALELYKTAFRLGRRPAPLEVSPHPEAIPS
jgi:NADH dehydrogenase